MFGSRDVSCHAAPPQAKMAFDTPRSALRKVDENAPVLTEWRLGLVGLLASLLVIVAKVVCANSDGIRAFFVERRLFSIEVISDDGRVMYHNVWKNVVRFSNVWLPALCGLLTTYFTWVMVYLDSSVPGVQPPSPFSPSKYKARSGHSFHLNYVFAVVVGVSVAAYMYWRNVSIEFF